MVEASKTETLYLKWGSVKGWDNLKENSVAALQKWADLGASMSAMTQPRTDEHKTALCGAIEVIGANGGVIFNDWTGEEMQPEAAKAYVMEYGA